MAPTSPALCQGPIEYGLSCSSLLPAPPHPHAATGGGWLLEPKRKRSPRGFPPQAATRVIALPKAVASLLPLCIIPAHTDNQAHNMHATQSTVKPCSCIASGLTVCQLRVTPGRIAPACYLVELEVRWSDFRGDHHSGKVPCGERCKEGASHTFTTTY